MEGRTSVIVTVRNEAQHIDELLESLVGQEGLADVVVVDAGSDDGTVERMAAYQSRLPLKVHVEPCSRGEGRNIGARLAQGDILAFIDGDCTAHEGWVEAISACVGTKQVAAGRTVHDGRYPANRLPIMVQGHDVTWPSCNLAYPRKLFDALGGFDASMVTGEDIDLNLRAVNAGAAITVANDAVVVARTRGTLPAHLRQAYSYGIGRRQLLAKHPGLPVASKRRALRGHASPRGILRLAAGWLGYRFGGTP